MPRIAESYTVRRPAEDFTRGSPLLNPARAPQLAKMPSLSPCGQTALRSNSPATMRTDDATLVDGISMRDETHGVQVLSEHLIGKARRETNLQRKERLLTFAQVSLKLESELLRSPNR